MGRIGCILKNWYWRKCSDVYYFTLRKKRGKILNSVEKVVCTRKGVSLTGHAQRRMIREFFSRGPLVVPSPQSVFGLFCRGMGDRSEESFHCGLAKTAHVQPRTFMR